MFRISVEFLNTKSWSENREKRQREQLVWWGSVWMFVLQGDRLAFRVRKFDCCQPRNILRSLKFSVRSQFVSLHRWHLPRTFPCLSKHSQNKKLSVVETRSKKFINFFFGDVWMQTCKLFLSHPCQAQTILLMLKVYEEGNRWEPGHESFIFSIFRSPSLTKIFMDFFFRGEKIEEKL